MSQLDVLQRIFFRDRDTQLVLLGEDQVEPIVIIENPIIQPEKIKKPAAARKSGRSGSRRYSEIATMVLADLAIEPIVPCSPTCSAALLQSPLHTRVWIEGEHVGIWWDQVDGAAEYELWVAPQAFCIAEPPATRLYRGMDHAFAFPVVSMAHPGFYHFQVRAVDGAGRCSDWSFDKTLPLHVPILNLETAPEMRCGELSLQWERVEGARYYEIQIDHQAVCSSEVPSKCLENLPLGLHDLKVRPIFSGGATEWRDLLPLQVNLEPPLEITPQEVIIYRDRESCILHWYCAGDMPVDQFIIVDPDQDERVLGKLRFETSEKNWLDNLFKSRKGYRWPIPTALQNEGQRFAVQAVKGSRKGPLSEIKSLPRSGKAPLRKIAQDEVECCVVDLDSTLRDFLRKRQAHDKLVEQKLEMYESPSRLRQYSLYRRPVLQAMNLQPRMDYRLSLTLNNGQIWQIEIIFNPQAYKYKLTFQEVSGV